MIASKTVAIVTGVSQGIGRATALRLARDFRVVVLAARNEDGLEKTAADISSGGAEATAYALDLSEPQSPQSVIKGTLDRFGSDVYLCGPSSFLQDMLNGLRSWSVHGENVHTEVFGAIEGITPGMAQVEHTPHQPAGPPGSGLLVSFARSGVRADRNSKFGSLLDLAEACDVPVRWSCRDRVCHTCMTGPVGGSLIINRNHSRGCLRGMCSCAAHNPQRMLFLISEA